MLPVTVTEAALSYLSRLLSDVEAGEEMSVRIEPAADGISKLTIAVQDVGDQHFKHEGHTVLVLDKETSRRLAGEAVDGETSDGQEPIVLRNDVNKRRILDIGLTSLGGSVAERTFDAGRSINTPTRTSPAIALADWIIEQKPNCTPLSIWLCGLEHNI